MRIESSALTFQRQIRDPRPQRIKDFLWGTAFGISLAGVYKGIKVYKE